MASRCLTHQVTLAYVFARETREQARARINDVDLGITVVVGDNVRFADKWQCDLL